MPACPSPLYIQIFFNVAAAIIAVYICDYTNTTADSKLLVSLLVTPTIFPLAFSIAQSHSRRERALIAVAGNHFHPGLFPLR
jgi:flagellar biosynthesis component FlhA